MTGPNASIARRRAASKTTWGFWCDRWASARASSSSIRLPTAAASASSCRRTIRWRLLDCRSVKVTALAGGVGGAKLLRGLAPVLGDRLTAIVNTGDDHVVYGVHVSPDLDIVTYWLADIADTARGWGLKGDTFEVLQALERLGVDAWFSLGDRDLATCIRRTQRLAEGASLTVVTDELRRA